MQQVADLLQVNKSSIYRMVHKDELPAFGLAGDWRFDRKQSKEWYNKQTQKEQRDVESKHFHKGLGERTP